MATTGSPRRPLRFETIDQVLADVGSLVEAEAGGRSRRSGNWALGQSLHHLASWVDYAYDGLPFRIPPFVRWLVRPMKRRILSRPLPAGVRFPWIPGGTLAIEPVATGDAVKHLHRSFARLARECPSRPHPLLGPITHEDWTTVHLRHAELHLSFLAPG